jgi:hypothetical protein
MRLNRPPYIPTRLSSYPSTDDVPNSRFLSLDFFQTWCLLPQYRHAAATALQDFGAGKRIPRPSDPNSVYYLSRYYTFGAGNYVCMILPADGDPLMHVADLEIPSAVADRVIG